MHMKVCFSSVCRHSAALVVFAVSSVSGASAQQAVASTASQPVLMASAVTAPLNLDGNSGTEGKSYSSSAGVVDGVESERFNLSSAAFEAYQPPPRRRYGRPNYHDSHTNPDGSNKYAFMAGGGMTIPMGNTFKYLKTNYAFQVGGGRNFNKQFGVMAQFDYDNFVFQNNNLANQITLYNSLGAGLSTIAGNSHVWSFSINPTYYLTNSDKGGAYLVVGVGFFHKTANFTTPGIGTYCSYYGCYQYQANQTIDKYTSNAPGFSGGLGITHKISRFANEQFYAEARYVFVDNSQKFLQGTTTANSPANGSYNFYPANSNRTTYIPLTVGLRF